MAGDYHGPSKYQSPYTAWVLGLPNILNVHIDNKIFQNWWKNQCSLRVKLRLTFLSDLDKFLRIFQVWPTIRTFAAKDIDQWESAFLNKFGKALLMTLYCDVGLLFTVLSFYLWRLHVPYQQPYALAGRILIARWRPVPNLPHVVN